MKRYWENKEEWKERKIEKIEGRTEGKSKTRGKKKEMEENEKWIEIKEKWWSIRINMMKKNELKPNEIFNMKRRKKERRYRSKEIWRNLKIKKDTERKNRKNIESRKGEKSKSENDFK